MDKPVEAGPFSRALALDVQGVNVAAAVSGGADSMALLLLLKQAGAQVHALTVDHGLRAESAAEAQQVGAWCKNFAIPHTILHWEHNGVTTGMQQKAREARYALMLGWCRAHGVSHLFTAHHADDQMETFLLRLLRESGMDGLAGILPVSMREGIYLHRPLLTFSKDRLIATLKAHRQPWLEDASNRNDAFTRVQLRQQLAKADTTTKERISQLTFFFQKFRNTMENKLSELIDSCVSFHDAGYAWLDSRLFSKQPHEMQWRLVQHLCMLVSGDATPPRSEKIERIAKELCAPSPQKKMTLHGVVFSYVPKRKCWLVYREAKRIAGPMALSATRQLWDGRFSVHAIPAPERGSQAAGADGVCGPRSPRKAGMTEYYMSALGTHAKIFAEALEKSAIPKAVWPTLPAIYRLEECIAVPHIAWMNRRHPIESLQVSFMPSKLLAGARDLGINQEKQLFKGECVHA